MISVVFARAREILRTLEGSRSAESRVIEHLAEEVYLADEAQRAAASAPPPARAPAAADGAERRVAERIRALDPDRMTPMDALALLTELRGELSQDAK